jgi:hypothetical protein
MVPITPLRLVPIQRYRQQTTKLADFSLTCFIVDKYG